jgi:hypothetical protein
MTSLLTELEIRERVQRRMKETVDHFAREHPDFYRYYKEIVRLIRDYDASLPGAYRVAKERGRHI